MGVDLERLAIPENFAELFGDPPELRNPTKGEDVFVHPEWTSPEMAAIRKASKFLVVGPNAYSLFAGRMFTCELRPVATGEGSLFVWPVRLDSDSAKKAADQAAEGWHRVVWDPGKKAYEVQDPAQQHDQPNWVYPSFQEIVDLVLKDRVLDSPENPIVQRILGTASKQQS